MKKNNKKSIFTRKQKLIIIIVAILAFFLIVAIALNPTGKKTVVNSNPESTGLNKELKSIEDVIKHYECTYYETKKSTEDGYDIDVLVGFKYKLYEGDESKEIFFKNLYERVAMVSNFQSFRLIDEAKGITIGVKCNSGKISEVFINGIKDYYKNENSKRSKENALVVDEIKVNINSEELDNLIESSWRTELANLGTAESTFDKYDLYFDEGYEIRSIQGRVFNIVFNKKYNKPVIDGIKPGEKIETVVEKLGNSYNKYGFVGYKTKDFYIYFTEDDISIYPNRKTDYEDFENLVKEYNEKKNINDFLDKLTDIWPDYDKYEYDESYVEIWYTLKGVKIQYNSVNPQGIQIYENYRGELKDSNEKLADVFYKLDQNLLIEKEQLRKMSTGLVDNSGIETDPIHYSQLFLFRRGSTFKSNRIISLTDRYPSSDIDVYGTINSYVWCDDTHLLFSIKFQGLYMFNAETRELSTLIKDETREFNITDYDRRQDLLEFDGEKVHVDY